MRQVTSVVDLQNRDPVKNIKADPDADLVGVRTRIHELGQGKIQVLGIF